MVSAVPEVGRCGQRVSRAVSRAPGRNLRYRLGDGDPARSTPSRSFSARKDTVIPLYQFRCERCGDFDRTYAMAAVPDTADCPVCAAPGRRTITGIRLGRGSSPQMRLLDATARTAHEPDVVSGPRPGTRRAATPVTTNPLHRKLPRP